jgi:hypothetical protein
MAMFIRAKTRAVFHRPFSLRGAPLRAIVFHETCACSRQNRTASL